jgi:hypothetical protein
LDVDTVLRWIALITPSARYEVFGGIRLQF